VEEKVHRGMTKFHEEYCQKKTTQEKKPTSRQGQKKMETNTSYESSSEKPGKTTYSKSR